MANTIQIKRAASTSSTAPSLSEGELAYNEYDKELFIGTSGSSLQTIGGKIGETVQAYDAGLAAIAGLTTSANKMVYTTGSDVYVTTDLTSTARTLLDDTSVADMRTTLGVDISGTVNYSLPTAEATVLGGIKVGDNLTMTNGVLAAGNPTVAGTHLAFSANTLNVQATTDAEHSTIKLSKRDSNDKLSAMGFKIGRNTSTNTTPFGIEAYDHYNTTFRKLQWVPDSATSGGNWKIEDDADTMRIIAHEGNKADFQRGINATLTSTSNVISLAASQGKILQANIANVEDKVEAVRYLFQNKLDIIQDTNFDWYNATYDISLEILAITVGNAVATSQALRDHINQVVSGYKRGDVSGDGTIDVSDSTSVLRYLINNPDEGFSSYIVTALVQPMYDDATTWSAYHSAGYFKTNASLPAAQVTQTSTKRLITDAERTNWGSAYTWYSEMTTADADTVMNTWLEVQTAVDALAESDDLLGSASTIDGGTF